MKEFSMRIVNRKKKLIKIAFMRSNLMLRSYESPFLVHKTDVASIVLEILGCFSLPTMSRIRLLNYKNLSLKQLAHLITA